MSVDACKTFIILDGTLLSVARIAADRPFHSGTHKKLGVDVRVLADPSQDEDGSLTASYTSGVFDTPNFFHVSSVLNRRSIAQHGLDWTRMGAAPGIAGSRRPEVEGVFVCRGEEEAEFFLHMINNTGGPVDLWSVDGIDQASLLDNGNGFDYVPSRIPASRVRLVRSDVPPRLGS